MNLIAAEFGTSVKEMKAWEAERINTNPGGTGGLRTTPRPENHKRAAAAMRSRLPKSVTIEEMGKILWLSKSALMSVISKGRRVK